MPAGFRELRGSALFSAASSNPGFQEPLKGFVLGLSFGHVAFESSRVRLSDSRSVDLNFVSGGSVQGGFGFRPSWQKVSFTKTMQHASLSDKWV